MSATIFYSVPAPAPKGLDTGRYVVSIVVERADRKPLTEADCALVERLYAKKLASEGIEPTAKPKPATRAKPKPAARFAAKELRAPAKKTPARRRKAK